MALGVFLGDDQIIAFLVQREKIQIQSLGRSRNPRPQSARPDATAAATPRWVYSS